MPLYLSYITNKQIPNYILEDCPSSAINDPDVVEYCRENNLDMNELKRNMYLGNLKSKQVIGEVLRYNWIDKVLNK